MPRSDRRRLRRRHRHVRTLYRSWPQRPPRNTRPPRPSAHPSCSARAGRARSALRGTRRPPRPAATHRRSDLRDLDRAQHRDRRVAGEEEVVGHVVRHEQRREAGMPPDHARRRRQRARELGDLPEHEERAAGRCPAAATARTAPSRGERCRTESMNAGTRDEQRVRRARMTREPAVQRRRPVVHGVADRAVARTRARR